jgi:hypothetical protein
MALPSGVYVIENVQNHNWAILVNDNDGDDVISGTDADTSTGHKVESLFLIVCSIPTEGLRVFFAVGDQEASQRNVSPP